MAADEAAMFLELAEIERDVGHVGRQDAARGAARQIAFEVVALGHAAAQLDQVLAVEPAAVSTTPGFLTRPETE